MAEHVTIFEMGPRGATPGKRLLKMRVASRDGGRLTPEAVVARNLSSQREERDAGETLFGSAPHHIPHDTLSLETIEHALIAGKILCYAQGFGMIAKASTAFEWSLPLPAIAEVWRAGCIIRSDMLDDMATALREAPERNLMMAPHFAELLKKKKA